MEIRFFSKEDHAYNRFHFHDPNEIVLVMSEGNRFYVRNVAYPLTRGSVFLLNSADLHRSVPKPGTLYQFYSIRFYSEEIEGLNTKEFDVLGCYRNHETFNHRFQLSGDQLDHILKLINKAEYYLSPDCSAYGKEIFIKMLLAELLIYINFLYKTPQQPPQENEEGVTKLLPVINFIHERISEDLSLERLSKEFFMNKYYISHRFKEIMGIPLSEYITNRRLSEAKTLLRGGAPVALAGERSGFNSCSHFIRTFSKNEGISPKRYAKQYLSINSYLGDYSPHRSGLV